MSMPMRNMNQAKATTTKSQSKLTASTINKTTTTTTTTTTPKKPAPKLQASSSRQGKPPPSQKIPIPNPSTPKTNGNQQNRKRHLPARLTDTPSESPVASPRSSLPRRKEKEEEKGEVTKRVQETKGTDDREKGKEKDDKGKEKAKNKTEDKGKRREENEKKEKGDDRDKGKEKEKEDKGKEKEEKNENENGDSSGSEFDIQINRKHMALADQLKLLPDVDFLDVTLKLQDEFEKEFDLSLGNAARAKRYDLMKGKPLKVVLCGPYNVGKSYLARALCGGKRFVVKSDRQACTIRRAHLTAAGSNEVAALINKDGEVEVESPITKEKGLPSTWTEREKDAAAMTEEWLAKSVHAKIAGAPFLECGIELIDTPGFFGDKELPAVDECTLSYLKKLSDEACVVLFTYSIDQDAAQTREALEKVMNALGAEGELGPAVLFVCNKVEARKCGDSEEAEKDPEAYRKKLKEDSWQEFLTKIVPASYRKKVGEEKLKSRFCSVSTMRMCKDVKKRREQSDRLELLDALIAQVKLKVTEVTSFQYPRSVVRCYFQLVSSNSEKEKTEIDAEINKEDQAEMERQIDSEMRDLTRRLNKLAEKHKNQTSELADLEWKEVDHSLKKLTSRMNVFLTTLSSRSKYSGIQVIKNLFRSAAMMFWWIGWKTINYGAKTKYDDDKKVSAKKLQKMKDIPARVEHVRQVMNERVREFLQDLANLTAKVNGLRQQREKLAEWLNQFALLYTRINARRYQNKFGVPQTSELLGSGSSGAVMLGSWNGSNVAVKLIPGTQFNAYPLEPWLHYEKLKSCKAVVRLKGWIIEGEKDLTTGLEMDVNERVLLMMEPCVPLHSYLNNRLRSQKQVLDIAQKIATSIQELHRYNVLHRDIKLDNLLAKNGSILLCDFGASKLYGWAKTVLGTSMAPEVLTNTPYTEKVDIFSFGVLLWEMWRLWLLQSGHTERSLPQRSKTISFLNEPLPELPNMPRRVRQLIDACCSSVVADRPSADELIRRLDAYNGNLLS